MFGIDDIISVGLKVLDKVIPDPAAKAAAQLELIKLQQAGDFKQLETDLAMAQMQSNVNAVEAASGDPFASRWRPFIGWVCGAAFAMNFVFGPLGAWISALAGHPTVFPTLDMSEMLPVLLGMLGLGTMRTYEKQKGVA